MSNVIEEIQDSRNIISYGRAVYSAAKTVVQKYAEGYDALINPSRGANPIARGIFNTIHYMARSECHGVDKQAARRLADNMYFGVRENPNHSFPFVPIPLTADINLSNEDLRPYGWAFDQIIDDMRLYGANFIRTLSYRPEKRQSHMEFRLLSWIFSELENRPEVSQFYESLPPIKRPIFIDTALSGRASRTIIEGFGDAPIYSIVFADKSKKLREHNAKFFQKKLYSSDGLKIIPMRRIVSEDQGAALLGLYAVFYPQILLRVREMLTERELYPYASAVTWHDIEKSKQDFARPYQETFASFMGLISKTAEMMCKVEGRFGDIEQESDDSTLNDGLDPEERAVLQTGINSVFSRITGYKVPRTESSVTIKKDLIFLPDKTDTSETHSHVVQVWLPETYLEKKMQDLQIRLFGN
ncbi:MAG: hypothetical protein HYW23_00640 [Candidatus Aenigmarchaeota archaeon]|nr:hypothetical protein [Candidatus Aenigmarchaeota archaeon]